MIGERKDNALHGLSKYLYEVPDIGMNAEKSMPSQRILPLYP